MCVGGEEQSGSREPTCAVAIEGASSKPVAAVIAARAMPLGTGVQPSVPLLRYFVRSESNSEATQFRPYAWPHRGTCLLAR